MQTKLFVRVQGKVIGPLSLEQLRGLRDRGQFRQFHEGSADRQTWVPASTIPELFPPPAQSPTASPPAPAAPTGPPPAPLPAAQRRPRRGRRRGWLWGVAAVLVAAVTAGGVGLVL